ncbi:hypothetical protein TcCL_NonESM02028, partial [Trypanosoma cruzi]
MCKQLVVITVTAGRRGRWVRGGHAASVVRVTVEVVCTRHLVVNLRQAPSDGNSIFTHHLRHSVPRRCSSRSTREKERERERASHGCHQLVVHVIDYLQSRTTLGVSIELDASC